MQLAKCTSIVQEDAERLAASLEKPLATLSGTNLLVTGAAGFLLSFLLDVIAALNEHAFAAPCKVIALDNFKSGLPERIEHLANRSDITFVKHDIREAFVPPSHIDWLIHGASIASPSFYRQFPLDTIDVNVTGTRHMLDLCRQSATSMLYLSTSEIYGDPHPSSIPTPESYWGNVSCTGPRACYDESKRLAETLCTTYFRLYETPVKTARPFNVYGPGQRLDDGRIIPDLIRAALKREDIVLYSDGKATRSFCYVSDAVNALLLLLVSESNGEAFNIGNDEEEVTIGDVANLVSDIAGPPNLAIKFLKSSDSLYLTDNPQRRRPDLSKLRTTTGFSPAVNLKAGLTRTLSSYKELLKEAEELGTTCV
jgi:UDP-glucuronate decarboxylase